MLYKHFASKHALFCATLTETLDAIEQMYFETIDLEDGEHVLDRLIAHVRLMMRDPQYQQTVHLRYMARALLDHADVRETVEQIELGIRRMTTMMFEAALAADTVRQDISVEYVVSVWSGLTFQASYRSMLNPNAFEDAIPHAVRFLEDLRVPAISSS